jgi:hypothetical protein
VFELVEAALDLVAQGIDEAVDGRLHEAVSAEGDDRGDAALFEIGPDGVAVVPLVGQEDLGSWTRLLHERAIAARVGRFPRRQRYRDGETQGIGPDVDLGREATSRASKILRFRACFRPPFLAPPACWWARTIVLSII